MDRRFFIAWVVTFVLWMLGGFLLHVVWLSGAYANLGPVFRPLESQGPFFPFVVIAHALMAGAFVWIYRQGVTARPFIGQGLRYGAAIALLTAVPIYLIAYAVQPIPRGLVARQIVGDSILTLVLGLVVAWLHRATPAT